MERFAWIIITCALAVCFALLAVERQRGGSKQIEPSEAVLFVQQAAAADPYCKAVGLGDGNKPALEALERLTRLCLRTVAAHPEIDWRACARQAEDEANGSSFAPDPFWKWLRDGLPGLRRMYRDTREEASE